MIYENPTLIKFVKDSLSLSEIAQFRASHPNGRDFVDHEACDAAFLSVEEVNQAQRNLTIYPVAQSISPAIDYHRTLSIRPQDNTLGQYELKQETKRYDKNPLTGAYQQSQPDIYMPLSHEQLIEALTSEHAPAHSRAYRFLKNRKDRDAFVKAFVSEVKLSKELGTNRLPALLLNQSIRSLKRLMESLTRYEDPIYQEKYLPIVESVIAEKKKRALEDFEKDKPKDEGASLKIKSR